MKQDLDLSLPRRLSIYVREEHPELLLEISEKIVSRLILRLELNQRDYDGIKAMWTFMTMYCIVTRDLWLFKRIYRNLKLAEVIFNDALKLLNDKILDDTVLSQYTNFFIENKNLLTKHNLIVSHAVVENWLLIEHYFSAVDGVAVNYIVNL